MKASRMGSSISYGGRLSVSFWSSRSSADGGRSMTRAGMTRDCALRQRAEAIHQQFAAILDGCEAARHVAVQGGIAHRHLALVAGGEQHLAGLVGDAHEQHAAAARLNVLLRGVGRAPGEFVLQAPPSVASNMPSMEISLCLTLQPRRLQRGVVLAHLRGVARGHRHRMHAIRAQRIDRDAQGQRRIDAPGQVPAPRPGKRCLST